MLKLQIHIYKDAAGEFRWHAKRSGRIVAEGGEGYKSKCKLKKTLLNIEKSFALKNLELRDTSTSKTW